MKILIQQFKLLQNLIQSRNRQVNDKINKKKNDKKQIIITDIQPELLFISGIVKTIAKPKQSLKKTRLFKNS